MPWNVYWPERWQLQKTNTKPALPETRQHRKVQLDICSQHFCFEATKITTTHVLEQNFLRIRYFYNQSLPGTTVWKSEKVCPEVFLLFQQEQCFVLVFVGLCPGTASALCDDNWSTAGCLSLPWTTYDGQKTLPELLARDNVQKEVDGMVDCSCCRHKEPDWYHLPTFISLSHFYESCKNITCKFLLVIVCKKIMLEIVWNNIAPQTHLTQWCKTSVVFNFTFPFEHQHPSFLSARLCDTSLTSMYHHVQSLLVPALSCWLFKNT